MNNTNLGTVLPDIPVSARFSVLLSTSLGTVKAKTIAENSEEFWGRCYANKWQEKILRNYLETEEVTEIRLICGRRRLNDSEIFLAVKFAI